MKPRAHDFTRLIMVILGRMFSWRDAQVNVKPETFLRWHRKGFRLFWRWRSRPADRPRLPKDLRRLIRRIADENPTWGEERIANELKVKLSIQVSPRTVGKYLVWSKNSCGITVVLQYPAETLVTAYSASGSLLSNFV